MVGFTAALNENSSLSPYDAPALTPPPAIHETNVLPLWSRPFPPWLYGVRPNSEVQRTTVSSRRPRDFRSVSSAATGRSDRTHIFWKSEPGKTSPWLSQFPA